MALSQRITRSPSLTRHAWKPALLTCLAGAFSIGACGIGDLGSPINGVANAIEAAVASINVNSAQWQEIVRDLQEQIPDVENDIKADIDEILQRGIKATTVSVFATTDFVARRVTEALDRVKAKVTGKPIPVYPPAFLGFSRDHIDVKLVRKDELNLVTAYGYDFDHADPDGKKMELWMLRGSEYVDVSFALTLATHYEAQINLAANGIPMSLKCNLLQLRWNGNVISTLPIIQPDPPQPKEMVVNLGSIAYTPPHTRGDTEFDGNGPAVDLKAFLAGGDFIPGGARSLIARVYMFAKETEDDWTTAEGSSEWKTVYTAPAGFRILSILSATYSEVSYVDTNHYEDALMMSPGDLVFGFYAYGDSASGHDAGQATRVNVQFNQAKIMVIEDDPYFN